MKQNIGKLTGVGLSDDKIKKYLSKNIMIPLNFEMLNGVKNSVSSIYVAKLHEDEVADAKKKGWIK